MPDRLLCLLPNAWSETLVDRKPDCPNAAQHTLCPQGYTDFFEWAKTMNKTHRCTRCPGCLLWTVWIPRPKRKEASSSRRS